MALTSHLPRDPLFPMTSDLSESGLQPSGPSEGVGRGSEVFFSRPGPVDMWRSQLGSVLMEESGSTGEWGFKGVNS